MDCNGWMVWFHARVMGLDKTRSWTCTSPTLRRKLKLFAWPKIIQSNDIDMWGYFDRNFELSFLDLKTRDKLISSSECDVLTWNQLDGKTSNFEPVSIVICYWSWNKTCARYKFPYCAHTSWFDISKWNYDLLKLGQKNGLKLLKP